MLTALAVSGYRSLRDLVVPLDRLNLVTGQNGSGKSNLYRALRLLAEIAQGRVIPSLAREGGLQSTLWAGPESLSRTVIRGDHPVQGTARKHPISLRLGFASDDFSYAIDLGLPPPTNSAFAHDPQIKRECLWHGAALRPSAVLVERRGPLVKARARRGWRAPGRAAHPRCRDRPADAPRPAKNARAARCRARGAATDRPASPAPPG
jgi:predicted ATPase